MHVRLICAIKFYLLTYLVQFVYIFVTRKIYTVKLYVFDIPFYFCFLCIVCLVYCTAVLPLWRVNFISFIELSGHSVHQKLRYCRVPVEYDLILACNRVGCGWKHLPR